MAVSRVLHQYSPREQQIIEIEKEEVLIQIKKNVIKGDSIIYDNQKETALDVICQLYNRKIINIMIIAQTQSGKTGTMISVIEQYLIHPANIIPIDNIYIITGLSSKDWLEQTKKRMPNALENRIFHRDGLNNDFIKDIKDKHNILVIIDEIQIAAKENQTLHKCFAEVGFYNKQYLLEKDIKILEFTATPDGTVYDLMDWKENASKIMMKPGKGYISCYDLLQQKRVYQYKDLCCYDKANGQVNRTETNKNINEIKDLITKFNKAKYHLIRTPNGELSNTVIDNFKIIFGENMKYYKYNRDSDIDDINEIIKNEPSNDTFIFIKEKLRCAKTLKKTNLGIVYERYTNCPDDAVITQGLIGRGTGYDDNGESIYFTNIESIKKYKQLWDNNFEEKDIKWKSKTTKTKNNQLQSKDTFLNTGFIEGMESIEINDIEPIINYFDTFQEASDYVKINLGNKQGPRNPVKNINSDGFYECKIRNFKRVWSIDDMLKEKKCNITNKAGYGFRYCYEDIKNKSTLKFLIIHYPKNL